jgi:predicted DNA-binding transcriptional regulator AlpA
LIAGQLRGFHVVSRAKPCPKGAAERDTMTTGAMVDDEGLLTEQDAGELLQVPLSTLRRWQRAGTGPPCLQIGRQVRYRRVAVQRWLTGGLQAASPDEDRS